MSFVLQVTIVFIVILIAFALSVPHLPRHTEHTGDRAPEQLGGGDKAKIVQGAYDANERAHQQNHAEKCEALDKLMYLRSNPIHYGPPSPQLQCGEIVDADVTDIAGLLQ